MHHQAVHVYNGLCECVMQGCEARRAAGTCCCNSHSCLQLPTTAACLQHVCSIHLLLQLAPLLGLVGQCMADGSFCITQLGSGWQYWCMTRLCRCTLRLCSRLYRSLLCAAVCAFLVALKHCSAVFWWSAVAAEQHTRFHATHCCILLHSLFVLLHGPRTVHCVVPCEPPACSRAADHWQCGLICWMELGL